MDDLDRVNAPRKRFSIIRCVAALVSAPNMHEVAELFDTICDTPFEKALRFEVRVVALDIHVWGKEDSVAFPCGLLRCGRSVRADHTQPAISQKERAEAIPIARFALRSRDYVIERGHEMLNCVYIARVLGRGPSGMTRERSHERRRRRFRHCG